MKLAAGRPVRPAVFSGATDPVNAKDGSAA